MDRTPSSSPSGQRSPSSTSSTSNTEVVGIFMFCEQDISNKDFKEELESLHETFRTLYGLRIGIVLPLRGENTREMVRNSFMGVIKNYNSEHTVFVIFYGGHADVNSFGDLIFCCEDKDGTMEHLLNWSMMMPTLLCLHSNIIMILDCCYAAAVCNVSEIPKSILQDRSLHGFGNVDVLAVCAHDSDHTNEPTWYSWTRGVVRALKQKHTQKEVSSRELFTWASQENERDKLMGNGWPSGEILSPVFSHLAVNPERGETLLTPI